MEDAGSYVVLNSSVSVLAAVKPSSDPCWTTSASYAIFGLSIESIEALLTSSIVDRIA